MSRLGSCNKSAKVLRALRRAGFTTEPGGRHTLVLNAAGELVSTVPNHRSLNVNTLRAILRQCGLSETRFVELY